MDGKINKMSAKLVIAIFVVSSVTAVLPLAENAQGAGVSDQELTPNENYGWLNAVQVDGQYSDGADEPDMDCYIGQKEVTIQPQFEENFTDWANITDQRILTGNVKRLTGADWTSNESADWTDGTDSFNWVDSEQTTDTGPFTGSEWLHTYEFDVPNEATTGIYRIPLRLTIKNGTFGGNWHGPYQDIEYIYIEIAGNTEVAPGGITVMPGIEFKQVSVPVHNQGDQILQDVSLHLEESDLSDDEGNQITIHNPDDTSYLGSLYVGETDQVYYRFTVPDDMESQDYEVEYSITLTRSGDAVSVTEHGTMTVTVSKIAEITATIDQNTVDQGTTKKEFTVTFENTGNIALQDVKCKANTDGNFFFQPKDYYEEGDAQTNPENEWIELGALNQSESKDGQFVFGMDKALQKGEHRITFEFQAYFYDDQGEVTGDESYVEVHPGHQLVRESREPEVIIEVVGSDFSALTGTNIGIERNNQIQAVSLSDMGYQVITARIENNGYVDYTDTMVDLNIENTPFKSVESEGGNTVQMLEQPFTLNAQSTREVTFGVVTDSTFIKSRLENDRPAYETELTVTGLNKDTADEEQMTVPIRGQVRGIGPKVMIRGNPEENKVKAGKEFTLTYTLENVGDEPVRDLTVSLSPKATTSGNEFKDGQEAVFYQQATSAPGANIWSAEPEEQVLQPGESTTVTFEMVSSSDMQPGAIYHLQINVNGETSVGPDQWQSATTIRTSESESAKPMLSEEITWLLVAAIIGACIVVSSYIVMRGKSSEDEAEAEQEKGGSFFGGEEEKKQTEAGTGGGQYSDQGESSGMREQPSQEEKFKGEEDTSQEETTAPPDEEEY